MVSASATSSLFVLQFLVKVGVSFASGMRDSKTMSGNILDRVVFLPETVNPGAAIQVLSKSGADFFSVMLRKCTL